MWVCGSLLSSRIRSSACRRVSGGVGITAGVVVAAVLRVVLLVSGVRVV